MNTIILPAGRKDSQNAVKFIDGLALTKPWMITVQAYRISHTREQENYLWGKIYPAFIDGGGEALRGWEKKDLHEFLLGEHFGSETLAIGDKTYSVPLKRSSKLNVEEYSGFIEFIQRYAANLGIYIEDPK